MLSRLALRLNVRAWAATPFRTPFPAAHAGAAAFKAFSASSHAAAGAHRRRRLAVPALVGDGEAAAAAAAGSEASKPNEPTFYAWKEAWRGFLQYCHAEGHYAADPGIAESALESNAGTDSRW